MTQHGTDIKERTARRFGWLWALEYQREHPTSWHYDTVQSLLPVGHLRGEVLDAGCGAGHDTVRFAAAKDCQVIAVELSRQGVAQTARRTSDYPNATVIQADLEQLPIQENACQ